jgi:hypothetical protein
MIGDHFITNGYIKNLEIKNFHFFDFSCFWLFFQTLRKFKAEQSFAVLTELERCKSKLLHTFWLHFSNSVGTARGRREQGKKKGDLESKKNTFINYYYYYMYENKDKSILFYLG